MLKKDTKIVAFFIVISPLEIVRSAHTFGREEMKERKEKGCCWEKRQKVVLLDCTHYGLIFLAPKVTKINPRFVLRSF